MAVIADLIRNPVAAQHWIPGRARDDRDGVWDDKTKGRGTFAESPVAARLSTAAFSDIGDNLVDLR